MTRKEILLIIVLLGSIAVTILYLVGFTSEILIELVILATLAVSMTIRWERFKDSQPNKAKVMVAVHLVAMIILFCILLSEVVAF